MLRNANVAKAALRRISSRENHLPISQSNIHIRSSSSTSSSKEHLNGGGGRRKIGLPSAFALAGASLLTGYLAGTTNTYGSQPSNGVESKHRELPNGHPRGCCSCDTPHHETIFDNLTTEQKNLPASLAKVVGESNVLSGIQEDSSNTIYLKGARLGRGKALAIVTPTSLQDAVKALELVVAANCVVVPQGANTGLTGGSVPRDGENEQRPPVVINMRKLDIMFPIDNGTKVVCLAGAGIASLAKALPAWGFADRESHSTLGSTFLNPTAAAGK